jgi:hypothetical protein
VIRRVALAAVQHFQSPERELPPSVGALASQLERSLLEPVERPLHSVRHGLVELPTEPKTRDRAHWHLGNAATFAARAASVNQACDFYDSAAPNAAWLALRHAVDAARWFWLGTERRWRRLMVLEQARRIEQAALERAPATLPDSAFVVRVLDSVRARMGPWLAAQGELAPEPLHADLSEEGAR